MYADRVSVAGEARELLSCVAEQRYFAQLPVVQRRYGRESGPRVTTAPTSQERNVENFLMFECRQEQPITTDICVHLRLDSLFSFVSIRVHSRFDFVPFAV